MNYLNYLTCDTANGIGIRCTLFVSGCEIACKGCQNKQSWKLNAGEKYTKELENNIIKDLQSTYIDGLTISGGNPTHPKNYKTVLELCKRVKNECKNKNIWMWSGSTLEELMSDDRNELLKYVDILVDGKFIIELKDLTLDWRGSSNQRVIELNKIK